MRKRAGVNVSITGDSHGLEFSVYQGGSLQEGAKVSRVETSWHPWQNSSPIRNPIEEGHRYQFQRVIMARVERAAQPGGMWNPDYLKGGQDPAGQTVARFYREQDRVLMTVRQRQIQCLSTEDGLARVQASGKSAARPEPFASKATKGVNVGSATQPEVSGTLKIGRAGQNQCGKGDTMVSDPITFIVRLTPVTYTKGLSSLLLTIFVVSG